MSTISNKEKNYIREVNVNGEIYINKKRLKEAHKQLSIKSKEIEKLNKLALILAAELLGVESVNPSTIALYRITKGIE